MIARSQVSIAVPLVCTAMTLVALAGAAYAADAKPDTKELALNKAHFDPVIKDIEGWTVYVDPRLLEGEHAEEGARALKMLANHLQRIATLMRENRLEKTRELEIWIEHHAPELGAMQYHPDVDWLTARGYDARLAKKVHIPRAASLCSGIKWSNTRPSSCTNRPTLTTTGSSASTSRESKRRTTRR